jgi:hypothetical protein
MRRKQHKLFIHHSEASAPPTKLFPAIILETEIAPSATLKIAAA